MPLGLVWPKGGSPWPRQSSTIRQRSSITHNPTASASEAAEIKPSGVPGKYLAGSFVATWLPATTPPPGAPKNSGEFL
jgi:hypothetical protein